MNEVCLKPVIDELETLFSKFNKAFFEGKLEKPVITVSPDHTRGAYGWCTGWKAWQVRVLSGSAPYQSAEGFPEGGGSSSRKYVCPCCGTIIRATKEVHVLCGECEVAFEEQE